MTYETAISALDAARTGDELIRTLDTLDGDLPLVVDYENVATLEPMEFWSYRWSEQFSARGGQLSGCPPKRHLVALAWYLSHIGGEETPHTL